MIARVLIVAALVAATLGLGSAAMAETPTPTPTPTTSSTSTPGPSGSPTPTPTASSVAPGPADGSPVTPVAPKEDADELVINAENVVANDWMTAEAKGYEPGEKVQFVLYRGPIVVASFVADSNGTVVAEFRMPPEIRPGEHVLEATGWESKQVSNAAFQVIAPIADESPGMTWLLVVIAVLVASLIALAIHFRQSIGRWFSGQTSEEHPS